MASETVTLKKRTRIVCISDTHNQTPKLPQGDILIHAGDLTNQGSHSELQKAVQWLESANFEQKIVIAGNHDITLDRPWFERYQKSFQYKEEQDPDACLKLLTDSPSITYLNHQSVTLRLTEPRGPKTSVKIFGSPYSPADGLWAFGYEPPDAADLWSAIPLDTDIVVTHTPPYGHCDRASPGSLGGCEVLRRQLWWVRPKLAICGHKHLGRGVERLGWKLDLSYSASMYMRPTVEPWVDPGAGQGSRKESRLDLSWRSSKPLQHSDVSEPGPVPDADNRSHNSVSMTPAVLNRCRRDQSRTEEEQCRNGPPSDPHARPGEAVAEASIGRMGRRETCIINAAYMATPYGAHKQFNKPIVVDVDLPVGQVTGED